MMLVKRKFHVERMLGRWSIFEPFILSFFDRSFFVFFVFFSSSIFERSMWRGCWAGGPSLNHLFSLFLIVLSLFSLFSFLVLF